MQPALTDIIGSSKPLLGALAKLGISDVHGLQLHLPLRYFDQTRITAVRALVIGEPALVQGQIIHAEVLYKPRKALICQLQDSDGEVLSLRFLHFYPSQLKTLAVGKQIAAYGEPRHGFFGLEMVHPECRTAGSSSVTQSHLTPIYPSTAGLSQASLRKAIAQTLILELLTETLPESVYQPLQLPRFADSLRYLHAPPANALVTLEDNPYRKRLALDELLAQQLSMRQHHQVRSRLGAPELALSRALVPALIASLPFRLTTGQEKVWQEIRHDLCRAHPMQRLLQGDVGSGKTLIALLAALQAIESGYQAAIMAPTEILAEQHLKKIGDFLSHPDLAHIQLAWLSGSQTKKARDSALMATADGSAQLIIGTHALFQEQVQFARLGLAIVDEQHRFGVKQRLQLHEKSQSGRIITPHQLMMSATPIPRTLAMSYYADLDVSVIDGLPPGRSPIQTRLVSDSRRDEVLARVKENCLQGTQAYWVCPLIEESEALQLQTAVDTHAMLCQMLPELQIGLVHGRMKAAEKQAVMRAFSQGELQLLVATTVIEVGVDVPNASLMVIEHAERMGLSQLHQLRGRVGRGRVQSSCILLYQSPLSQLARARLKIIREAPDGFAIAEADLHLRGPGEFMGVRQSGLPMLRIADLERDADLLDYARTLADQLLEQHPSAVHSHLQRWLPQGLALLQA